MEMIYSLSWRKLNGHETEDAVTKALDKILKKYNLVEKEKVAKKPAVKKSVDPEPLKD